MSLVTLTEPTKTYLNLANAMRDHLGLGLLVALWDLAIGLPFAWLARRAEAPLGRHSGASLDDRRSASTASRIAMQRGRADAHDVSFAVPAGAIAAIVGGAAPARPRCSAVSPGSTARARARSRSVSAGRGRGAAPTRLARPVGLVFQTLRAFSAPHAARNSCSLRSRARRVARPAAEATARALLAQLGLAEKVAAYPSRLSGGQCQRVAIARALAMAPACLLYDEPTSALGPSRRRELVEVLYAVAPAARPSSS